MMSRRDLCDARWRHRPRRWWQFFSCRVHACFLSPGHTGCHVCASCNAISATSGGPR